MSEPTVEPYTPELSEACLALERACPQGEAFRLSFRRRAFHLRAQNFREWGIFVAREGDRVLGTAAVAFKTVFFRGERRPSAFFFDLRVHPEARRRGVAQRLTRKVLDWADARGAALHYLYCVDDNRAMRNLASLFGGGVAGGYRYLVWPAYRNLPVERPPREVTAAQVHEAYVAASGPFDFYCNPLEGGDLQGHVLSLLGEAAGCSLWSNAGLLEEVVEATPWVYGALRRLLRTWPLRTRAWPHLPQSGEALRSWYVYDFFAARPAAGRQLMRQVNNLALARGIDFCYVICTSASAWLSALQEEVPRLFAPLLPYCLLVGPTTGQRIKTPRIYVDIRDL
jgi:GNAT superfamily N-acetyltransferase